MRIFGWRLTRRSPPLVCILPASRQPVKGARLLLAPLSFIAHPIAVSGPRLLLPDGIAIATRASPGGDSVDFKSGNSMEIERGFSVVKQDSEELIIDYRPTGNAAILLFLIPICTILPLAVGHAFISDTSWWFGELHQRFTTKEYGSLVLMTGFLIAAVSAGLSACVWGIGFCAFNIFGILRFDINNDTFSFERKLFFWQRLDTFRLSEIDSFCQVKDGGEGDDSFPSYALILKLKKAKFFSRRKTVYLLQRQQWNKSHWLGKRLASRLSCDFHFIAHEPIAELS